MVECADGCTLWQWYRTPLFVASLAGETDVVQVLVDSKADLEALDEVAMWAMQEYKACLVPHPLRVLPSQLRQGDGV